MLWDVFDDGRLRLLSINTHCQHDTGWQASLLLTNAWWARNSATPAARSNLQDALRISKPFTIHKRIFGKKTLSNLRRGGSEAKQRPVSHCRLYEVVKSKWSCSANQYLHILHERIADDLSEWKITSIRLNRAYAWRTRVCVCPSGVHWGGDVCVVGVSLCTLISGETQRC